MRAGRWKLVWAGEGPWELFDMTKDRTEMNNLFESMPGRAADMKRTWESWARRTGMQLQTSLGYYKMIGDYQKSQKLEPDPAHCPPGENKTIDNSSPIE